MLFVSALTFGPIIGGIAGGIGSAIADIIGFPLFAIPTLIIKGVEGFLVGIVAGKKQVYKDVFVAVFTGAEMVVGYFLVAAFVFNFFLL